MHAKSGISFAKCARFRALNVNAGYPNSKGKSKRIKSKPRKRNQIDCQRLQSEFRTKSDPISSLIQIQKTIQIFFCFFFKEDYNHTHKSKPLQQHCLALIAACFTMLNSLRPLRSFIYIRFFLYLSLSSFWTCSTTMVHSILNIILAHILIFTFAPFSIANKFMHLMVQLLVLSPFTTMICTVRDTPLFSVVSERASVCVCVCIGCCAQPLFFRSLHLFFPWYFAYSLIFCPLTVLNLNHTSVANTQTVFLHLYTTTFFAC